MSLSQRMGLAVLAVGLVLAAGRSHATCPELRGVKLRQLKDPAPASSLATARRYHAVLQRNLPAADLVADANAVARLASWTVAPGGGTDISVLAVRRKGAWKLYRASQSIVPVPPPPRFRLCGLEESARACLERVNAQEETQPTVVQGDAPPDLARALDAAFLDACLLAEPAFAPQLIPMVRGQDNQACYDGGVYVLELRSGAVDRVYTHACQARWRAGALMETLSVARPTDPAP